MSTAPSPAVLVVGVRSPAGLELVRQLAYHGLAVEGADFLHFPLGRFSWKLKKYHRLPSPRWQPEQFTAAWAPLARRSFAAVFACNEEIFWLSRHPIQPESPIWAAPAALERLHRKDHFVELLEQIGLPAPRTWTGSELKEARPPWILKRIYSRFGISAQLDPTTLPSEPGWLAQQRLTGEEVCFTGFAWQGELVDSCCYRSRWGDLGQHRGAGLHFQRVFRPELLEQAEAIVRFLNYSGPLGLDFVGGTAVECNPRWTSGIHMLDLSPALSQLGLPCRPQRAMPERVQLAAPMLLRSRLNREFWGDWWSTPDVIWSPADPLPALTQPLALAETFWRARREKIGLSQALTWDIEWNGPEDVAGM